MPCNSGPYPTSGEDYEARRRIEKLEAMLCALIRVTTLEGALESADWEGAGVAGADLKAWWEEHQRKDTERLAREKRLKEAEERRQQAMAKLTPEEREALGLKR